MTRYEADLLVEYVNSCPGFHGRRLRQSTYEYRVIVTHFGSRSSRSVTSRAEFDAWREEILRTFRPDS